jgi:hypothetical protein
MTDEPIEGEEVSRTNEPKHHGHEPTRPTNFTTIHNKYDVQYSTLVIILFIY